MRLRESENKIKKRIASGVKQSLTIAPNTILDIHNKEIATFSFRAKINGKRKRFKIGTYGESGAHFLTIEDAIKKATDMKRLVLEGTNPQWAHHGETIRTTDDLFKSFFKSSTCAYTAEKRMYEKYIKPEIGDTEIAVLTTKHLQLVLKGIVKQELLSVAERCFYLFRSVFDDAFYNSIVKKNIARNLDLRKHAGGGSKKQGIALTQMDVQKFLEVARQHPMVFPEPSLIAITMLLVFGFRKMELLGAQWKDLDWDQKELHIWADRSKNKLSLAVPIPDSVIPLFKRLQELAMGSDYLFPARRRSSTPHVHDSTLNAAINTLFGKNGTNKVIGENILGSLNVPCFKAHDLRRTFRSLLPRFGVSKEIAESCMNHKPRGVHGVYNRYDYISQRKEAHDKIAKIILPLAGFEYFEEKQDSLSRDFRITSFSPTAWTNNLNFNKVA
ncbi:site-specific integrase [Pseudoalteromonas sp. L21]|uniref:tyrosine-type recombinase/integrase n=1 Tax=Pseudoalteromonas sp. L21 TaxID=1539746 RepID=UPI001F4266AF|nr:site-specific integrase [Pseudoalteromonas sp. L21]MCF7519402.1 site-specific integrase [Pseudoalteromonas sp. L21]